MTPEITPVAVGIIGFVILIILMFAGVHLAVVMGLVGFFGMAFLVGWPPALGLLKVLPYNTFANYDLSVLPLFVLMGEFCFYGGISSDLYKAAHDVMGSLKGGLAMATIGGCAGFAAVSGSSMATAATMATVALPEMKRYGYDPGLATGTLAAGGTLGILIPPSGAMIIYGMVSEQSIGQLFLAGFIPGIMQATMFILSIYFICWRNPLMGPPGPTSTFINKLSSLKNTWIVLVLFVLVIFGIYLGVFSPTEGAGVGATGAFIFALARRRLGWKEIRHSFLETTKVTAMLFFIIAGALVLNGFLAVTRLPYELATFVGSLPVSPYVIWFFVVILYIFLGCLMDSIAMILLTVPILFPLMCGPTGLGFDGIWFGIMVVILVEMGMITPPVGMNCFVIKGMAPEVPTPSIFKGIMTFVYMDAIQIVILTAFPGIVLFLPQVFK